MGHDKKSESPVAWFLHACWMLLGAAIALNLAVAFLRPILPWIICAIALVTVTWIAVAIVRWRQSQW